MTTPLLLSTFLWCTVSAQAQRPEMRRPQDQQTAPTDTSPKKPKHSARAIGVVEFLPGGATRLVPVALWYEGKYYDASTYDANPAPLAVAPGTVYQALNNGEPAGIFVVSQPKLSNAGWIGSGRWTPRRALDEQLAAEAAKQAKPTAKQSKAIFTGGPDAGPPVLKRPGAEQSPSSAKAPEQTQAPAPPQAQPSAPAPSPDSGRGSSTTSDASAGRPTLRRPNDDAAPAPAPAAQPAGSPPQSTDDNDPDRPVFRKRSPPSTSEPVAKQSTSSPSSDENDPNRPLLTRGQPAPAQAKAGVPASGVNNAQATSASKAASTRSLAAISDAGKYETRPLVYATTPEQQQQLAESTKALALNEIRAYAAKHATGPQLPKSAAIADYDFRLFDLDFSNSPTLVLTAKLPVPTAASRPFVYYATFIAHVDINGEPVKVFSSVTDSTHLDVFPRLELVDAVDADANGRGDLLFRQYSDAGINYGLYRVFPYNMEKIFEGGGAL